ncbi:hypothetical protein VDGL01_03964 [Verticillium dahliae]
MLKTQLGRSDFLPRTQRLIHLEALVAESLAFHNGIVATGTRRANRHAPSIRSHAQQWFGALNSRDTVSDALASSLGYIEHSLAADLPAMGLADRVRLGSARHAGYSWYGGQWGRRSAVVNRRSLASWPAAFQHDLGCGMCTAQPVERGRPDPTLVFLHWLPDTRCLAPKDLPEETYAIPGVYSRRNMRPNRAHNAAERRPWLSGGGMPRSEAHAGCCEEFSPSWGKRRGSHTAVSQARSREVGFLRLLCPFPDPSLGILGRAVPPEGF